MISLGINEFDEVELKAGQVLFKRGEQCKFSYIVTRGHIASFSLTKDKRVIPLFSVKDNGLVGEDNVFVENPVYRYNSVALADSTLIKIPNEDVMTYLNEAGDWMKNILFDLADKVSNTTDVIIEHKIVDDRLNGGDLFNPEEQKTLLNALNK